MSGQLSKSHT